MRSLIISTLSLLLVVSIWFGFMIYCEDTLSLLSDNLADDVQRCIVENNWPAAAEGFDHFTKDWHQNKSMYSFFLEQSALLDTDFSIARAQAYIQAQDLSNSLGELSCIQEQLKFLLLNEQITLENIL